MNKREESKLRTRSKVLEAAEALFAEPGFEATTIKMIAEKAGCATGSVFTTFTSKEEILTAIVAGNYEATAEAFRKGAEGGRAKGVAAELKGALRAGIAIDYPRRNLVVHQIAASWTWTSDFDEQTAPKIKGWFGVIGDLIDAAKQRGEIRASADTELLADLILGMYLRLFRHDRFKKLGLEGMGKRADGQIDLLLEGARVRSSQASASIAE